MNILIEIIGFNGRLILRLVTLGTDVPLFTTIPAYDDAYVSTIILGHVLFPCGT